MEQIRKPVSRRTVVASMGATLATPFVIPSARAATKDPIRFAIVAAQSGQAGVADHTDYINGATLAVKDLNTAGGINGREIRIELHDIDILTPEGTQTAFRKVADSKPHAIGCAFTLIRLASLEGLGSYKAPYLSGDTSEQFVNAIRDGATKYDHVFQVDPPEIYYGRMFPNFLDTLATGGTWKPTNKKVHLIREQSSYNMTIARELIANIKDSGFEIAKITDITFPVQDWGPVMQDLKETQAGAIMLDYWVGAEEAAFCQQFVSDPIKGALVYIQYGPSQPEFLTLAGPSAEGFVWSTVLGGYADEQGMAFRKKYAAAYPGGVIGLCYNASAYDTVNFLAQAWGTTPAEDFKGVADYVKTHVYRGVTGALDLNNDFHAALHYPLQTQDLNKGMAQLFFQVQDGAHKIIQPDPLAQGKFRNFPWA